MHQSMPPLASPRTRTRFTRAEEADVVTLHAGSKIGCVTTGRESRKSEVGGQRPERGTGACPAGFFSWFLVIASVQKQSLAGKACKMKTDSNEGHEQVLPWEP